MQIVYALEQPQKETEHSIFLAGPSPRRCSDLNWRPEAIAILDHLEYEGTVYVPLPRDGNWTEHYYDQINWELKWLDKASTIAFWVPRSDELPAYTTNVEFGLYIQSGKCILGYPTNALKMRYLHHLAYLHGAPVFHSLYETIAAAAKSP